MGRKRHFGQVMRGKRKGTWRVRWRERGSVRQKTITGGKDLAERLLAKKQTELAERAATGQLPIVAIQFEEFLDQYERLFSGEKAPATVIREARYLRSKALPFFRGLDMGQVTRADIERFLIKRTTQDKISGSTRNKLLNMLSRIFQKAIALNHAAQNPVAGDQAPTGAAQGGAIRSGGHRPNEKPSREMSIYSREPWMSPLTKSVRVTGVAGIGRNSGKVSVKSPLTSDSRCAFAETGSASAGSALTTPSSRKAVPTFDPITLILACAARRAQARPGPQGRNRDRMRDRHLRGEGVAGADNCRNPFRGYD